MELIVAVVGGLLMAIFGPSAKVFGEWLRDCLQKKLAKKENSPMLPAAEGESSKKQFN